jgi:nucleoside-diphosphate-sugar epimerase
MMARAFGDYARDPGVLVFASGVSDSMEQRPAAFDRERGLLTQALAAHRDALLLYFGTCSIYDPGRRETPYVRHKLAMEELISTAPNPWMVLRLPLAIGPGHRGNTLANYLYERIQRGEPFDVWAGATRYPIDVEDSFRIASRLLADRALWRRRINVALRPYRIMAFVDILERIMEKRANYSLLQKGRSYEIDCPEVAKVAPELQLDMSEGYLEKVLRKYFRGP